MAIQRDRGSIVDTITLKVFNFQWEPTHKASNSTKFGKIDIFGKRLPVRHWVGEGDSSVDITLHLTGVAHVDTNTVSSKEVGALRYNQMAIANKTGSAVDSVADAQAKIRQTRKTENKSVLVQIQELNNLKEPQEDTGFPHPVFLNIGGSYAGRKFVVEEVQTDYLTHNYATMEPTEASVKIKLSEVTDFRKR